MVELAGERGYGAVTVRALTRLAGVSTHTFYDQFDGKEACLLEANASVAEEVRRALLASRDPSLAPPVQLDRSLAALLRVLRADPAGARLALLEIYSGGPAAHSAIAAWEAAIASALGECLNRRGARARAAIAAWVTAGALHIFRRATLDAGGSLSAQSIVAFGEWAAALLEPAPQSPAPQRATAGDIPVLEPPGGRAAILAAVLRLAVTRGYWNLSIAAVCRQAGISRRGFRREFESLDASYLEAIAALSRRYLAVPNATSICDLVSAEPALARVLFVDILAPGRAGLLARETLVAETAARWRAASSTGLKLAPVALGATVAALWSDLASELASAPAARIARRAGLYAHLLRRGLESGDHARGALGSSA